MSSEILDIEIQLKIDRMRAELEKIPGISSRESKKMAVAWSRDYAKVEKSAERAAREAERAAERVRDGWKDSAERTASLMGGVFGDISDSVLDLGSKFGALSSDIGGTSGAIVGITGVTAGLAAAAGFAAFAFVEWMGTSEELRKSLVGLQGVPPIDVEHTRRLLELEEASRDATAMLTRSTLQLQAEFAPAVTQAKYAVIGLTASLDGMAESQGGLSGAFETFQGWMETVNPAVYLYNSYIDDAAEKGKELAESIELIDSAFEEYGPKLKDAGPNEAELAKQRRAAAAAAREAAKAAKEEGDAIIASLVGSFDAMVAYETQQQAAQETAQAASDAQREQLEVAGEAWARMSKEAGAYAKELEERVLKGQLQAVEMLKDATLDFVQGAAQNKIDALTNEEHAARKLHQRELSRLETEREAVKQELKSGKISEEQAKDRLKEIDAEEKAQRAARRKERKERKKALLDAHKASQAAARARAIIDAAANAVALTTSFAYLSGGAPAAALAVAGAQLKIQLGVIKNTKPPKFATGGMVRDRIEGDHAVISASPDEGILTPRGVSNAGGPAGVDALNRGTGRAGSGGSTAVYLDGRMLGEVVARVIETDRQVGAALDRRIGMVAGVAR